MHKNMKIAFDSLDFWKLSKTVHLQKPQLYEVSWGKWLK